MKFTTLFMPVVIGLLVICGPVSLPQTKNEAGTRSPPSSVDQPTTPPTEEMERSPVATPAEEVVEAVQSSPLASPSAEAAANSQESQPASPQPASPTEVEGQSENNWNADPAALIVSATFCCGFTTEFVPLNYIPDAQIWGDGRIIWVQEPNSTERHVLTGQLAPNQIQALLQRAVADGFFDWQDNYANRTVSDFPDKCLLIELDSQVKKVCEYVEGAPPAFHELYAYITSGMGVAGTEYVPELGYLIAYPVDFSGQTIPQVDRQWPADSLGLSLGQAVDGVWVEDEALKLAWEVVNTNWMGMLVQEGEAYYQISIQIPGVSHIQPPVQ